MHVYVLKAFLIILWFDSTIIWIYVNSNKKFAGKNITHVDKKEPREKNQPYELHRLDAITLLSVLHVDWDEITKNFNRFPVENLLFCFRGRHKMKKTTIASFLFRIAPLKHRSDFFFLMAFHPFFPFSLTASLTLFFLTAIFFDNE